MPAAEAQNRYKNLKHMPESLRLVYARARLKLIHTEEHDHRENKPALLFADIQDGDQWSAETMHQIDVITHNMKPRTASYLQMRIDYATDYRLKPEQVEEKRLLLLADEGRNGFAPKYRGFQKFPDLIDCFNP